MAYTKLIISTGGVKTLATLFVDMKIKAKVDAIAITTQITLQLRYQTFSVPILKISLAQVYVRTDNIMAGIM